MRRLAALLILLALTAAAPAAAMQRGAVTHNRLVHLVGHRLHHARATQLRLSRHAVLRVTPNVTRALRGPAAPEVAPTPAPAPASAALSSDERAVVDATNRIRVAHGLRALAASAALSSAANVHSLEMLKRGYFEHESANGEEFWVRVQRYYPRNGAHTWSVGENIAYGCPELTVAEGMDMWMNSAGHRANILHGAWTEIGVSIVHVASAPGEYQGDETTVMTVDFGVRK